MGTLSTIVPYLWFDNEAIEAAEFYTSVFPDSQIRTTSVYKQDGETIQEVAFDLGGQSFFSINAGPLWKINPAISFMVNFDPSVMDDAKQSLKSLWQKLSEGGKALMPLDAYDFSPLFGWVEDKFGVSWQLILTDPGGDPRPFIMPAIMFTEQAQATTLAARRHYLDVFEHTEEGLLVPFEEGQSLGEIMFSDIKLENLWYVLSDSFGLHDFSLNGAISFMLQCDTQDQVDYYWHHLSADPSEEQCGWLKDKNGVYWQIVPRRFLAMIREGSGEQVRRVMEKMQASKKLVIAELEEAYRG